MHEKFVKSTLVSSVMKIILWMHQNDIFRYVHKNITKSFLVSQVMKIALWMPKM